MSMTYGQVKYEKWEEILEPLFAGISMMFNFFLMMTYWLKVPITTIFEEIVIKLRGLAPILYETLAPYEQLIMTFFFGYIFFENILSIYLYYKSKYVSYEKVFSSPTMTLMILAEIMISMLASMFLPPAFVYVALGFIGLILIPYTDKIYIEIVGSPRYELGTKLETAEKIAQEKLKQEQKQKVKREIAKIDNISRRVFWGLDNE